MGDFVVRLMADAICPPGDRQRTGPCALCRAGARRAYDVLEAGGYLRDPDSYSQALWERFGPVRGRR